MRRFFTAIAVVIVVVMLHGSAWAFWGLGGSRESGSGLDLVQGYDRNTVVTLTGRVAASPDPASDPVTMELLVGTEKVTLVLGPRWYLQDDTLEWKNGDTVTVRGSKAQGKDGRTYLLTQSINTPGSGQMILRNESGRPGWSGGSVGAQGGSGGVQQRSGGGAGMRRGR